MAVCAVPRYHGPPVPLWRLSPVLPHSCIHSQQSLSNEVIVIIEFLSKYYGPIYWQSQVFRQNQQK
jgi:hypothetical protein